MRRGVLEKEHDMYKKEKNGMKEEIQANYHSQERLVCTVDITKRMVSWHAHPMNKFVHHIWVGLEREPSVVGSHDYKLWSEIFSIFLFHLGPSQNLPIEQTERICAAYFWHELAYRAARKVGRWSWWWQFKRIEATVGLVGSRRGTQRR